MSRHAARSDRIRLSGATMVEILVAVAIFAVLLVLFLVVWRTTPRQTVSVEKGTELVHAASVLASALSWDLARSHPASAVRETPGRLVLALHAGYDAAAPTPITTRAIEYAFDETSGSLKRDRRVLIAGALSAVQMRWTSAPVRLAVSLTGKRPPAGDAPRMAFELAAPPATSPLHWRFAAHHRAARAAD